MVPNMPPVYYEKFHFRFFKDLKSNLDLILYIAFLEIFPAYLFYLGHRKDGKLVKLHTLGTKVYISYDQWVGR